MTDLDRRVRIAGALYTLTFVPGVFSLIWIPDRFIVTGNPAATIANIAAGETLYRWGVFGEVAGAALWVVVVVALYRVFADVDRFWAALMAWLGLMCAPVMLLNVMSELALLSMLHDPGYAAAFSPAQLQKLGQALLRSHGQGFVLLKVFSGLWLFPLAVVVWRCGFLPRALAVLQAIAGLAYMVSSSAALLAPSLSQAIDPVAGLVSMLGETPAFLWLLLVGARLRRTAADPVSAAAAATG